MCRPQTLILCSLLAFVVTLSGCNKSASTQTGSQSGNLSISSTSLQAITLSADNPAIPVGLSESFQATGSYSDGTSAPLGAGLIWTSSDTNILTVDSNGLATGMNPGSANVMVQDPVSQAQGSLAVTVTSAVLQSLSVYPASNSLPVGLGVALTAVGHFSDGTSLAMSAQVTWQSATPSIAVVDATGLVTGIAVGERPVTITASFNGQSGSAQVTVTPAVLQTVTVSAASPTIAAGLTTQLTVSGTYSDGSTPDLTSSVTWTSSNPNVATVSGTGLVTGLSAGTVTISATYGGQTWTAQVTVSPAVVQALTGSAPSAPIVAGLTVQLTASGSYSDGSTAPLASGVTWTSSNNTVAIVSGTGLVTGLSTGTVTISATYGGQTWTAQVAVSPAQLQALSVSPVSATVVAGQTTLLAASGHYSDGSTAPISTGIVWSSSDNTIATVLSGLVHGVSQGTVTVAATVGSLSGTAQVTVSAAVLQAVTVNPAAATIAAGMTAQLTASGSYSNGSTPDLTSMAAWTSSNPNVVTVSGMGVVKGLSAGTATISAAFGGQTGTAQVTVSPAVLQDVTCSPESATVARGVHQHLTANGIYSDGSMSDLTSDAKWTSSDTSVAAVSQMGLVVTGKSAGAVTITADYDDWNCTAQVTVTPAVLQTVTVSPPSTTIAAGLAAPLAINGIYSDGTTAQLSTDVSWSSSDNTVATVINGVVTGVAPGAVTVTATVGKLSGTAQVTVSPAVLETVTVSPATATVAAGLTTQLAAGGTLSDGTAAGLSGVTWTSSNNNVATVNGVGLVTGKSAGTVTISAAYGGLSGTAQVTVTSAVLEAVTVSPASATVAAGQTTLLAASGTMSDSTAAALSGVTWTSSNTGVVTVSAVGLVTGKSQGAATIIASYGGYSGTAQVTVTSGGDTGGGGDHRRLVSIRISCDRDEMTDRSTMYLSAIGTYSDGTTSILSSGVNWSASNPGKGGVSQTGLLTAYQPGADVITASDAVTSLSGSVSVNIRPNPEGEGHNGHGDGNGNGH